MAAGTLRYTIHTDAGCTQIFVDRLQPHGRALVWTLIESLCGRPCDMSAWLTKQRVDLGSEPIQGRILIDILNGREIRRLEKPDFRVTDYAFKHLEIGEATKQMEEA